MNPSADHWTRVENLFHETVDLPKAERTRVLEDRCGTDTLLMQELLGLLEACEAEQTHQQDSAARIALDHPRHVGPYRVVRRLGSGGMGAVYLADRDDGHFTQRVAIKVIDMPLATEAFQNRFRTERQILAGLSHPYIARLVDGGVSASGELYLAMEYVDGISIERFCDERALSERLRLELFCKVCQAVQSAHQDLVVHRDLKPDNILVVDDGTPRLLDFGTAKILASPGMELPERTQAGMQAFTPLYASPEQVLGWPITTATDIYSLGVLLFLLLTGKHPYHLTEFTTDEMVRVICHEPPRELTAAGSKLETDLHMIVAKAMRKEPRDRYETVQQLSQDVKAYLENRPVLAHKGNRRYVVTKFWQRNRFTLSAAVLLCLTMVAGAAAALWQAHRASLQQRRAEARTADLRELSNSLLSELDEALKEIPGSTGAQKLLVTRVVEHLDRMARDAASDRQTALDLAAAYTRLGNVQGNLYEQNTANVAEATSSFRKAIALTAPLVAANPRDKDALRAEAAALEARGETLSEANDAMASFADLQGAVSLYDRVLALPGLTPALIFEAAIANETLGNELGEDSGLADGAAAIAAYRHVLDMEAHALSLDPGYMPIRRGLPVMHMHIGNALLDTDPVTALREFQYGMQLEQELPPGERSKRRQVVMRALLWRKQAVAEAEMGQYTAAWQHFAQAEQLYRPLALADRKDAKAAGDLARLLADEAQARLWAADPVLASAPAEAAMHLRAALQVLNELAGIQAELLRQAPGEEPWVSNLARTMLQQDEARRALGLQPGNETAVRAALTSLLQRAETPTATANNIDLAVSGCLHTQAVGVCDGDRVLELAVRGTALTHHRSASYLLLMAEAAAAAGNSPVARSAAQEGLAVLDKQDPKQTRSRLRKLLTHAAS